MEQLSKFTSVFCFYNSTKLRNSLHKLTVHIYYLGKYKCFQSQKETFVLESPPEVLGLSSQQGRGAAVVAGGGHPNLGDRFSDKPREVQLLSETSSKSFLHATHCLSLAAGMILEDGGGIYLKPELNIMNHINTSI